MNLAESYVDVPGTVTIDPQGSACAGVSLRYSERPVYIARKRKRKNSLMRITYSLVFLLFFDLWLMRREGVEIPLPVPYLPPRFETKSDICSFFQSESCPQNFTVTVMASLSAYSVTEPLGLTLWSQCALETV